MIKRLTDFLDRTRERYPWRLETSGNAIRPRAVYQHLGRMIEFIRVPQFGPHGELYIIWGFEYSEDRDLFIRTFCTQTKIGERYKAPPRSKP